MRTLETEVTRLRDRQHALPNALQALQGTVEEIKHMLSHRPPVEATGERRAITMRDIYVGSGVITAFTLLLKMIGKL